MEEKTSSDIDIAIDYSGDLPKGVISSLREVFEESSIPYRVDIVDLTKADREFKSKVMKEAIIWKDSSKG